MRDEAFTAACRLLGVPEDAPREEVDEAFRERRLLYAEDNLATYSLYGREERDEQIESLRAAYQRVIEVLDREAKPRPPAVGQEKLPLDPPKRAEKQPRQQAQDKARPGTPAAPPKSSAEEAPRLPAPPFEAGESPGAYLRRCRESLGLSIAFLAAETRIGSRHLEGLEADSLSDLQAEVYVRGFVTTYARALRASPIEEIVRAFLAIFRKTGA